jgi:hypothetical protein
MVADEGQPPENRKPDLTRDGLSILKSLQTKMLKINVKAHTYIFGTEPPKPLGANGKHKSMNVNMGRIRRKAM